MKTFLCTLLLAVFAFNPALAQTNLAGTWQGRLEVAPDKVITIQFVIAATPGGGYSTIVTSPDTGAIKNVSAAKVGFADNRLTIDVPALSGGYAGTLRNGVLEGEWSQEGTKLPLSLRPYTKPTLTAADIKTLSGEWFGKLSAMGREVTIVLRFSTGADGALAAVLDVPEQGARDLATQDIELDDGNFSIKAPKLSAEITGQLKGEQISGQWQQMGISIPLTLKKGRYVAAASYLDLPAAAYEQLKGRWKGALGPLGLVLRFEKDAKGRTLAFLDSPQQQAMNIAITDASLTGTKLTFGIVSLGAKYTADLADGKLTGEWTQAGMQNPAPLVLTREK